MTTVSSKEQLLASPPGPALTLSWEWLPPPSTWLQRWLLGARFMQPWHAPVLSNATPFPQNLELGYVSSTEKNVNLGMVSSHALPCRLWKRKKRVCTKKNEVTNRTVKDVRCRVRKTFWFPSSLSLIIPSPSFPLVFLINSPVVKGAATGLLLTIKKFWSEWLLCGNHYIFSYSSEWETSAFPGSKTKYMWKRATRRQEIWVQILLLQSHNHIQSDTNISS